MNGLSLCDKVMFMFMPSKVSLLQPLSLELAIRAFVLHMKTMCSEKSEFLFMLSTKTLGLIES